MYSFKFFYDRVVSLVIEDTIKNFLFQPSESSNKNQHEGSPDKIKDKSKVNMHTQYLL